MKYEEVINKSKKVKAPDLSQRAETKIEKSDTMENILNLLKKTDSKTRLGIRVLQLIYLAMILVAVSYILISSDLYINLGIASIIIAFALVIFVQQLRFRAYSNNYTNNPVIKYLHEAKKRMRVFTPRTYYVILIWLFIDIGVCLILKTVLEGSTFYVSAVILLQALLIILVIIDFYTAYLIWIRDHQPVIIEIDKLLDDFEAS
jgi:hypothetical protein